MYDYKSEVTQVKEQFQHGVRIGFSLQQQSSLLSCSDNICVSTHLRHLCVLNYSGSFLLRFLEIALFFSCFKDTKLWLIYFGQRENTKRVLVLL